MLHIAQHIIHVTDINMLDIGWEALFLVGWSSHGDNAFETALHVVTGCIHQIKMTIEKFVFFCIIIFHNFCWCLETISIVALYHWGLVIEPGIKISLQWSIVCSVFKGLRMVVPWLRPCTRLRLVQGLRPRHNPACLWSPQCTGNHS